MKTLKRLKPHYWDMQGFEKDKVNDNAPCWCCKIILMFKVVEIKNIKSVLFCFLCVLWFESMKSLWFESIKSLWFKYIKCVWFESIKSLWFESIKSLWFESIKSLWFEPTKSLCVPPVWEAAALKPIQSPNLSNPAWTVIPGPDQTLSFTYVFQNFQRPKTQTNNIKYKDQSNHQISLPSLLELWYPAEALLNFCQIF